MRRPIVRMTARKTESSSENSNRERDVLVGGVKRFHGKRFNRFRYIAVLTSLTLCVTTFLGGFGQTRAEETSGDENVSAYSEDIGDSYDSTVSESMEASDENDGYVPSDGEQAEQAEEGQAVDDQADSGLPQDDLNASEPSDNSEEPSDNSKEPSENAESGSEQGSDASEEDNSATDNPAADDTNSDKQTVPPKRTPSAADSSNHRRTATVDRPLAEFGESSEYAELVVENAVEAVFGTYGTFAGNADIAVKVVTQVSDPGDVTWALVDSNGAVVYQSVIGSSIGNEGFAPAELTEAIAKAAAGDYVIYLSFEFEEDGEVIHVALRASVTVVNAAIKVTLGEGVDYAVVSSNGCFFYTFRSGESVSETIELSGGIGSGEYTARGYAFYGYDPEGDGLNVSCEIGGLRWNSVTSAWEYDEAELALTAVRPLTQGAYFFGLDKIAERLGGE